MFSSKAVTKLVLDNDIESLIVANALESIDLPQEIKEFVTEEFCDGVDGVGVNAVDGDGVDQKEIENTRKRKGYKPREFMERAPKESSAWHRRYLAPEKRDSIQRGESDPNPSPIDKKIAAQFKTTFRVYWSLFLELKQIILEKQFHDPRKKDALGFSHDIELLILGLLFYVGWDTTFDLIATNTEIDGEVHRTFHHKICGRFKDIKDEYIYLPRNEVELEQVVSQYTSYGFPGCVGSIDVVHIAWGNYPERLRSSWESPSNSLLSPELFLRQGTARIHDK